MAPAKKKVVKKKVATKKAQVKKATPVASNSNKLHAVLGDKLMNRYVKKCNAINTSKSETARILIEAFVAGKITISEPSVVQLEPISTK